jgi:hypothetical protein
MHAVPSQTTRIEPPRSLQQYDIPVLHLSEAEDFDSLAGRTNGKVLKGGRVMKHRIDQEKLVSLVQEWTEKLNRQQEEQVKKAE